MAANDSNHDLLLPAKGAGSCTDTCRSGYVIDTRERHVVCKLDRYQLEDGYLRLLDELQHWKKLSNTQEDKIKRLTTKLLRVAATPRSCLAAGLDFRAGNNDDAAPTRIDSLEYENRKLKDKVAVLKSQIVSHKIVGRCCSRNRRIPIGATSGHTTCRSEIDRIKSSSCNFIRDKDVSESESKNYRANIEQLEMEKKQLALRVVQLEHQLINHQTASQRDKVAENIEFIRVWRQTKQQNEELVATQALNVSLTAKVREISQLLENKTRNIREIRAQLTSEKKKLSDMEERLAKAKISDLELRDKDEQIKEFANEIMILQQYNAQLVAISSKCSRDEELKNLEKISDKRISQEINSESASIHGQVNVTVLQAVNEQLMGKLHDLQRNIDTLTIQLEANTGNIQSQISTCKKMKTVSSQTTIIANNAKSDEHITSAAAKRPICTYCNQEARQIISSPISMVNREAQTSDDLLLTHEKSANRNNEDSSLTPPPPPSPPTTKFNFPRQDMLKLLQEAQINTPLDAPQNTPTMRQIEKWNNYPAANWPESQQRQRPVVSIEKLLFGETPCFSR